LSKSILDGAVADIDEILNLTATGLQASDFTL